MMAAVPAVTPAASQAASKVAPAGFHKAAFGLVGVLTMSVLAAFGPVQQASAAPYTSKLCWLDYSSGQLKVYCVDIEVAWPWDKYFECWMCGLSFDWQHDPVIREDLEAVVGAQTVQVQVKGDRFTAVARTATADEKPGLWRLMADAWPDFDKYQRRTDREIPVVVLERVS